MSINLADFGVHEGHGLSRNFENVFYSTDLSWLAEEERWR